VLSNFKRWTLDIFHWVSPRHLQAYLDEFCDRLNRREKREDIFRRLLNRYVLCGTPATSSLLTGTCVEGMVMLQRSRLGQVPGLRRKGCHPTGLTAGGHYRTVD
jgi:hypothetical protein